MKRKLTLVGIFVGLAVAAVFVVLATRQDAPETARASIRYTSDGKLVIEPPAGRTQPTVVAHFPPSNHVSTASEGSTK
jgi:hypothetical protein